ncbi:MAG TPA: PhoPQ-activated protein PqaA family protein [Prosthecobacter sp.]|nr:PhoPQ-activated protein PqaA family protein [Prosthecobacter sp.]
MKRLVCSIFLLTAGASEAEILTQKYDLAQFRDATTLETKVIEDWQPAARDPAVKQKLVEITVCEWWPGQKVRLPVAMSAPVDGGPCENIIIGNIALAAKAPLPAGAMLRLLKQHRVGVVLIGMTTIDAMPPVDQLDDAMKAHLLKTKDMRYTPAWIWGISDMRALTAAIAEKEVFQPKKVLATGGSKRGVATAAAGIADDRFTAILPVVAPIIDSPGGPYVEGLMPPEITRMNEAFLANVKASKYPAVPAAAFEALTFRQNVRAAERITVAEARAAGWTDAEMQAASTAAWEVCRTTNYLPALQSRSVEIFYNQGTNDNVSPGLLELGRKFPALPVYIVPGGQHGGSKESGLTKQVGNLPEVEENLFAFAQHHFFNSRPMAAPPKITRQWDEAARALRIQVTFPDKSEPQKNGLWWSIDRHPDYSLQMEYDSWQSAPLRQTGPATYAGEISPPPGFTSLQFVTVHANTTDGSTLTFSSPLLEFKRP